MSSDGPDGGARCPSCRHRFGAHTDDDGCVTEIGFAPGVRGVECVCRLSPDALTNPEGYDVAEWSAMYDAPHHLYPGPPKPPLPRRSLVYFSGPPGVGKSTLVAHLTRFCPRQPLAAGERAPARDLLWLPTTAAVKLISTGAVEIGKRRDSFSGTDALPMNAVVVAEQYILTTAKGHGLIVAEGDRLANKRFLVGAHAAGWAVTLINMHAPAPALDARCRDRGSTQSAGWRAGRETKAINLAREIEAHGIPVIHTDARYSIPALAAFLVETVPVLAALLPADAPELHHEENGLRT